MKNTVSIYGRFLALLTVGLALLVFGFDSPSAAVEEKKNARINFVHLGSISDWRAEGDKAILIETVTRKWYRAEFFSPCYDLLYQDSVGFVASPTGRLDRFSAIFVGGRSCRFSSLERIAGPARTGSE